ncbi:uncharacterized protein ACLA_039600 [Aspergillus clavatus NRRL 1]|uniref:Uncharacterized protein n=1 Tax=Aspergillus clavatus (strain ATCC 1007 / CBS 513.65 / DSM 816 / NCTC 3887 / NRRL 1 / QM 1276 / 107) TaxID=344612 RepID=A1CKS1_ASPCL|nr:uncharacterized protein ACLA_039600 [Aspergillus clavatus NRRL 1]EAW09745.1 conserved hypothetical protein [Aspergillus clavatus NRRL 1]
MATEDTIGTVDSSPSKQDTANTIEAKVNGNMSKGTAPSTNSDHHPSQDAQPQPKQSQADGNPLLSTDETRSTENSAPVEQASALAEADTKTLDELNAGDKRGHDWTVADANGADPIAVADETKEPTSKKLKTAGKKGTNGHVKDEPTPAVVEDGALNGANREKKTKRSKKVKEAAKKAFPTDGIGSRTRSRTKAAS